MLTWRGISNSLHGKGTCDLFVGQLELREHLFSQYVPFLASKKMYVNYFFSITALTNDELNAVSIIRFRTT